MSTQGYSISFKVKIQKKLEGTIPTPTDVIGQTTEIS